MSYWPKSLAPAALSTTQSLLVPIATSSIIHWLRCTLPFSVASNKFICKFRCWSLHRQTLESLYLHFYCHPFQELIQLSNWEVDSLINANWNGLRKSFREKAKPDHFSEFRLILLLIPPSSHHYHSRLMAWPQRIPESGRHTTSTSRSSSSRENRLVTKGH